MIQEIKNLLDNTNYHLIVLGEKENGKSYFISELMKEKSPSNILILNIFIDRSFKNIRSVVHTFLSKLTDDTKYIIIHGFDDFNDEIQSFFGSLTKKKKKCKIIFVVKSLKYLNYEIKNISILHHPKLPLQNNSKKSLKYIQYINKSNINIFEKNEYDNVVDFNELLKLKSINSIINYHKIHDINIDDLLLFIQKHYFDHQAIIPFINHYMQSRIHLYSNTKVETNLIRLVFKFQNMFFD